MKKLHDKLSKRYAWYKRWHLNQWADTAHLLTFGALALIILVAFGVRALGLQSPASDAAGVCKNSPLVAVSPVSGTDMQILPTGSSTSLTFHVSMTNINTNPTCYDPVGHNIPDSRITYTVEKYISTDSAGRSRVLGFEAVSQHGVFPFNGYVEFSNAPTDPQTREDDVMIRSVSTGLLTQGKQYYVIVKATLDDVKYYNDAGQVTYAYSSKKDKKAVTGSAFTPFTVGGFPGSGDGGAAGAPQVRFTAPANGALIPYAEVTSGGGPFGDSQPNGFISIDATIPGTTAPPASIDFIDVNGRMVSLCQNTTTCESRVFFNLGHNSITAIAKTTPGGVESRATIQFCTFRPGEETSRCGVGSTGGGTGTGTGSGGAPQPTSMCNHNTQAGNNVQGCVNSSGNSVTVTGSSDTLGNNRIRVIVDGGVLGNCERGENNCSRTTTVGAGHHTAEVAVIGSNSTKLVRVSVPPAGFIVP